MKRFVAATTGNVFRMAKVCCQQRCATWDAHASTLTPLDVLGLDTSASIEDVRSAYRSLAKVHHPDCGGDPAQFKTIHEAYETCREVIMARGFSPSARNPRAAAANSGASTMKSAGQTQEQQAAEKMRQGVHPRAAKAKQQRTPEEDAAFWQRYRENKIREIHQQYLKRFRVVEHPAEIDSLMEEALQSRCMNDRGEPLTLALRRYHVGMGYGPRHIEKCLAVIDRWEEVVERQASCIYYQQLLELYTNNIDAAKQCGAASLEEAIGAIMDHMRAKGLDHDDYTYMLARFALSSLNHIDT